MVQEVDDGGGGNPKPAAPKKSQKAPKVQDRAVGLGMPSGGQRRKRK